MSVAEKSAESAPARPNGSIASVSLLLAAYAFLTFGTVFSFLPWAWGQYVQVNFARKNLILSNALLFLVAITVLGLFCYGGYKLIHKHRERGARAGAFFLFVAIFVIAWLAIGLGARLEANELGGLGAFIAIGLAVGGLLLLLNLFRKPGFLAWLGNWEDGGWFHSDGFKPNQGVRVRRATVVGILAIGASGIITMINQKMLSSGDWTWTLPFTSDEGAIRYIPLLHRLNLVVPMLLGAGLVWFAWRLVNYPVFADFLIATEAEMNKVSWTTRKRLVQDTIVVLVTVILMTTFLFFIDILWIRVLNAVNVLQVDLKAEQQRQQEKTQW